MITSASRQLSAWAAAFLLTLAAGEASAQWSTHADCANKTSAAAFRDHLVDNVLLNSGSGLPSDSRSAIDLDPAIGKCKAVQPLPEQSKLDTCVARPQLYSWLMRKQELGLVVDPDATPLVELTSDAYHLQYGSGGSGTDKDQLSIPSRLADAELFAKLQDVNLSNSASVDAAVKRIKTLYPAAIVVPYVSATTPGIDRDPDADKDRRGRIVVFIRNTANTVSHYIQFTVNANPATPTPLTKVGRQQASVVNYVDGKGAHVFDWKRDNGSATFAFDTNFGNDQQCYQCHSAGVLEIHPFKSDDSDAFGAGGTLGLNYRTWLDALNNKYAPDVKSMNAQIRREYETRKTVLHSPKRTGVLTGFPNGLLDPSGLSADCAKAYDDMRTPLTTKQWVADWTNYLVSFSLVTNYVPEKGPALAKCSSCHVQRGSAIFDAWTRGGFSFLMTKYVAGGLMPPLKTPYETDGEVVQNLAPKATRDKVAKCFDEKLRADVTTWLKATVCP